MNHLIKAYWINKLLVENFLLTSKICIFGTSLVVHGEGSGNPLQYSCLENPVDRGAVYGVAQSWT